MQYYLGVGAFCIVIVIVLFHIFLMNTGVRCSALSALFFLEVTSQVAAHVRVFASWHPLSHTEDFCNHAPAAFRHEIDALASNFALCKFLWDDSIASSACWFITVWVVRSHWISSSRVIWACLWSASIHSLSAVGAADGGSSPSSSFLSPPDFALRPFFLPIVLDHSCTFTTLL